MERYHRVIERSRSAIANMAQRRLYGGLTQQQYLDSLVIQNVMFTVIDMRLSKNIVGEEFWLHALDKFSADYTEKYVGSWYMKSEEP